MTTNPPNPSPEILKTIEVGSKRIQQLATQLSDRIERFEAWLGQLPGRVETVLWTEEADDEAQCIWDRGLRLHRDGKKWVLSHGYGLPDPRPVEWKLLVDASVETKIWAISLFPKFLEEIAREQQRLAQTLESAHKDFDEFAKAIGAAGKRGA